LQGGNDWERFAASSHCRPILDGLGNLEELRTPHRPGYVGSAVRLYDRAAACWRIHWVDNRSGVLQPPVSGRFVDGNGVFEGPDEYDGQAILTRFSWLATDTETPRWEQAFSLDSGQSWEVNWIMQFRRIGGSEDANHD
jgi:hypothetical protein